MLKDKLVTGEVRPFLTRKQTADYLQISLPTLHKYTIKGIIKCFRIGPCVRYRFEDLLNITSNKVSISKNGSYE